MVIYCTPIGYSHSNKLYVYSKRYNSAVIYITESHFIVFYVSNKKYITIIPNHGYKDCGVAQQIKKGTCISPQICVYFICGILNWCEADLSYIYCHNKW